MRLRRRYPRAASGGRLFANEAPPAPRMRRRYRAFETTTCVEQAKKEVRNDA